MYMSAHVLLNLLKELGKILKMRGLPSILSVFATAKIRYIVCCIACLKPTLIETRKRIHPS